MLKKLRFNMQLTKYWSYETFLHTVNAIQI